MCFRRGWKQFQRESQAGAPSAAPARREISFGHRVRRKDITAFTREISALLAAGIPIPQALDSLGEEEENPALHAVVKQIGEAVRKGESFSSALAQHPKLFSNLYANMIRVGEEAGVLPKVLNDLADLLEHEDEVRGEVVAAVAYPAFVLCFGFVTVTVLLTVVLPRLFSMLEEMLPVLPLPTLVLLKVSHALHEHWLLILICSRWRGWRRVVVCEHGGGRGGVGQMQIKAAFRRPGFSIGGAGTFCPDLGHAGQERRIAAARAEDCRTHHRQPGHGRANRAGRGGNARR